MRFCRPTLWARKNNGRVSWDQLLEAVEGAVSGEDLSGRERVGMGGWIHKHGGGLRFRRFFFFVFDSPPGSDVKREGGWRPHRGNSGAPPEPQTEHGHPYAHLVFRFACPSRHSPRKTTPNHGVTPETRKQTTTLIYLSNIR